MLELFPRRNHVSLTILSVRSSKIAQKLQSCFAQKDRGSMMCRGNVVGLESEMPNGRTESRSEKY